VHYKFAGTIGPAKLVTDIQAGNEKPYKGAVLKRVEDREVMPQCAVVSFDKGRGN
jgi:hypothetical protein